MVFVADAMKLLCMFKSDVLFKYRCLMPNTHRRHDETVELHRVGGVKTPVGSRDPVYNFLC